jgi:type IV secretory pathway protease TraF
MCTQAELVIKEGAIRSTFVLHSPNSMNGFAIGQHATSKDACPVSMGFVIMHLGPCSTQKVASRRNFMNLSLTELVHDTRNEDLDDVCQIPFPWFIILLLKSFPAKMPSSAQ